MNLRNGRRTLAAACLLTLLTRPGLAQQFGQKICEINADGTGYEELYVVPQNSLVGSPAISADGKRLALEFTQGRVSRGRFVEAGMSRAWLKTFQLSKLREEPTDQRSQPVSLAQPGVVVSGIGNGSMPSWSPQGHRLVFTIPRSGGAYVMGREGSNVSRVHPQGWGATWSPDGRMIAYINAGNGNVLMCYDLVEDEEFVVLRIQNSRIYSGFAWSPDSKSLAFCARTRGVNVVGRCDVLKRDTYQELRSGIVAQGIAWHPDGKRLLFASTTRVPFRLMTIPATPEEPGNQSPPQFIPGVPDTISAGNPVWSPDGKKIIFVATPTQ